MFMFSTFILQNVLLRETLWCFLVDASNEEPSAKICVTNFLTESFYVVFLIDERKIIITASDE